LKILGNKKTEEKAKQTRYLNQLTYVKEAKTLVIADYEGGISILPYDFEAMTGVKLAKGQFSLPKKVTEKPK